MGWPWDKTPDEAYAEGQHDGATEDFVGGIAHDIGCGMDHMVAALACDDVEDTRSDNQNAYEAGYHQQRGY
jgi:hypothetical protein